MARISVAYTLDEKVVKELRERSSETFIPQSRLVEQALLKLFKEMDQEKANKA